MSTMAKNIQQTMNEGAQGAAATDETLRSILQGQPSIVLGQLNEAQRAIQDLAEGGWEYFDDWNEGEEWTPEELPPELPRQIELQGRMVEVSYLRLHYERAAMHPLFSKMKPVLYERGDVHFRQWVPRYKFNGAGELRYGDLMTFVISKKVYQNWHEMQRRHYEMQLKGVAKGERPRTPDGGGLHLDPLEHSRGQVTP
jgi:hypothetical protein